MGRVGEGKYNPDGNARISESSGTSGFSDFIVVVLVWILLRSFIVLLRAMVFNLPFILFRFTWRIYLSDFRTLVHSFELERNSIRPLIVIHPPLQSSVSEISNDFHNLARHSTRSRGTLDASARVTYTQFHLVGRNATVARLQTLQIPNYWNNLLDGLKLENCWRERRCQSACDIVARLSSE